MKTGAFILMLSSLVMMGCQSGDEQPGTPDESGAVTVAVSAAAGLAGFQIDVTSTSGGAGASRFVPVAAGGGTVEALFTLSPGTYDVTVTPEKSEGVREPGCSVATAQTTIEKGKTTALMLIVRCEATGSGGLD